MFVTRLCALSISGLAAYLLKQPLIFPSLGPTALLFFGAPLAAQASPRNTLIGHFVGIGAGVVSLAVFGLLDAPSMLQVGVSASRIGAAAVSVALTGSILLLLRSQHPPAGATTLIVSLGLLTRTSQLLSIGVGVIVLTVVSWLINRGMGVPVGVWGADSDG